MGKLQDLASARRLIDAGEYPEAFKSLVQRVSPDDDFVLQARIAKLFSLIPSAAFELKPIRIALLASSTVDHFADILRFWLASAGFSANIWIASFDTITTTILDPSSELYSFNPDVVWLFTNYRGVRMPLLPEEADASIQQAVEANALLWRTLQSRLKCVILQNNADIPALDVFGNYAGQNLASQRNGLRQYNLKLAASAPTGVVLVDIDHLSSLFGKSRWFDSRYWYHSKHAFNFDACGLLAFHASQLLSAIKGRARKCLVLDLDNTLWGGVIGDDGISGIKLGSGAEGEAFAEFQKYLLGLKDRGIILAVCSKNEEAAAKEPFIRHPDCKLKLDDFGVFVANWNNKADNLREIATTLNIGLDSIVFADDNPVERNLVRSFLPMVAVPELPEDPSEFASTIDRQRYFETISYSAEDRHRSRFYRDNAARSALRSQFTDVTGYLDSLEMVSEVGNIDDFHLPRMAQLINKSNQFHLTGTRYSDTELQAHSRDARRQIRYYTLQDKFGDNGLIAVLILVTDDSVREMTIDTWVMSCRVLGRTMEEFICNDVIACARQNRCGGIVGRFIPSEKNHLVSNLYDRLGFEKTNETVEATTWRLTIADSVSLRKTSVKYGNPALLGPEVQ